MDLRLDDIKRPGEFFGSGSRLFSGEGGIARRNRRAELRKQFLGLIFVDVHDPKLLPKAAAPCRPSHFMESACHCGGRMKRRSEEQTSELQSLMRNSYAVFFLTTN